MAGERQFNKRSIPTIIRLKSDSGAHWEGWYEPLANWPSSVWAIILYIITNAFPYAHPKIHTKNEGECFPATFAGECFGNIFLQGGRWFKRKLPWLGSSLARVLFLKHTTPNTFSMARYPLWKRDLPHPPPPWCGEIAMKRRRRNVRLNRGTPCRKKI